MRRTTLKTISFAGSLLLAGLPATPATAEKLDRILVTNGNEIVGEVKELERGRLRVSTDYMGTVQMDWEQISKVESQLRELVDKTPGGKVVTRVSEHQGEGILMSISETKLPRLAMSFAGPKLIFSNTTGIVLGKVFGREISSERREIAGADAAMVLHYESVDFEDENHPGYAGLAIFLIVDTHIYVVNSMLSKDTPDNQASQEKLLGSIQVHG